MRAPTLEIPPKLLFFLDRLEECLEVALPEALRAFALNDLVEQRRPVFHRLREDLQQIAVGIAVDENAERLERLERFVDLAHPTLKLPVVGRGRLQEFHAAIAERRHRLDDVVGREREVLRAGATVEIEILLDLRLLLA